MTDAEREPVSPSSFERLAQLFLHADADCHQVIEEHAHSRRTTTVPSRPDGLIWGMSPHARDAMVGSALRFAVEREASMVRVRRRARRDGLVLVDRLRLPSTSRARRGFLLDALRSALLGGVLVDLRSAACTGHRRVMDRLLLDADVEATGPVRQTVDGGFIIAVTQRDRPAFLRASAADHSRSPRHNAAGLQVLHGNPQVPELLGTGESNGFHWCVEARLQGGMPRRLNREHRVQAAAFLAALPRADTAPTVALTDIDLLLSACPDHRVALDGLRRWLAAALDSLPSVLLHGDFWAGNLLVRGDRLTGVVDWDAWRHGGVPGSDLLHLVASELQTGRRLSLAEVCRLRPWCGEEFRELSDAYWDQVGVPPGDVPLDVVGCAWWLRHVAGTMERISLRRADDRWKARNVGSVLDVFMGR